MAAPPRNVTRALMTVESMAEDLSAGELRALRSFTSMSLTTVKYAEYEVCC